MTQTSYKTALRAKGIRPIPPYHKIRVANPKPGARVIVNGKVEDARR
jgi:hypothetical protein